MDVSIIITNYNTKDFLINCIKSIKKYTNNIEYEIIVIDNNSSDDSVITIEKDFPDVKLIKNNKNVGFGAANNIGKQSAIGKYVFYLNSDTVLLNNAVKIFFDYFENSKENLGAIGCNLLNENNHICASYGNFFSFKHDLLRMFYEYSLLFCFWKKIIKNKTKKYEYYCGNVDVIIGADLFMKNDENALFDEYFFLYHEETDLQLRLEEKKLIRKIIEGPEIIHFGGSSNNSVISKYDYFISVSRIYDRISRVKFYKKNSQKKYQYKLLKFMLLLIWNFPTIKKYTKKYKYLLDEI